MLHNGPAQLMLSWSGPAVRAHLRRGRTYEAGRHRVNRQILLGFVCEGTVEISTLMIPRCPV